ncbi:MAG: biphenyl 2,3-dioxygenase [Acidobacteria bacterium]|nr:biphenyl 2,3-dioxygenase [Acidobacteriota bacterium]
MPIVPPTKLAHVVYRTRRFDEMLRWYQTVFNARVHYGNAALAFLSFDDEHHRFGIANMSVFQPDGGVGEKQNSTGADHVGYTYPTLRVLLENYEALREQGIKPYWCIHHGITASMYYADPDGNQMEFQVDCLGSSDDASQFMATMFAKNPIGVEFDPEDWLKRLRSGTPETELLDRQKHEPISPIRGVFAQFMETE